LNHNLDCALTPRVWSVVQSVFGGPEGHTCDLMATDSNVQCDLQGHPLPHFTLLPTPNSLGVNGFAHRLSASFHPTFRHCYVFPPFSLVGSMLCFLREHKAYCTLVVPDRYPRQYWWPILSAECVTLKCLAKKGEVDVLRRPTKSGYVDYGPIPFDLWAFELCYA
jgi:hypothetical protein